MSSSLIACGSELRFGFGVAPAAIVRLAGNAGFDGVAVGSGCGLGDVATLISACTAAGLAVPSVAAPLPEGPLPEDRRLPYLASLSDSDERRAAVAAFRVAREAAGTFGVRLLTVGLGSVSLGVPADKAALRFARREWEDDEPGAAAWRAAVGERRALSGQVLDACRYALDRILPDAERRDAVIALELASDPWGIPSPREALFLIDEYRNGPIGIVWDQARMQALATLGIGPSAGRAAALAAGARLWRANEAVGIETGYLPGLGDPFTAATDDGGDPPPRPQGVPIVVTGRPNSRDDEVARARTLVLAPAST